MKKQNKKMYDTIKLISQKYPDISATITEVPAEVRSVTRAEFYKAKSVGILPTKTFVTLFTNYNDETKLEFHGSLWKVERTYKAPNSNYVELTCSGIELGEYNSKITIYEISFTQSENGFNVKTKTPIGEIYAYKQEKSANETTYESGVFPEKSISFVFEKPSFQLTNQHIVECDENLYNILGIIEVPGRESFIEVTVKGRTE
jgi:hypothetical protein